VAGALTRYDHTLVAGSVVVHSTRYRDVAICLGPLPVLPRQTLGVHLQGRGDQLLELLLGGLVGRFAGIVTAACGHPLSLSVGGPRTMIRTRGALTR